jgi:hypothetical protein
MCAVPRHGFVQEFNTAFNVLIFFLVVALALDGRDGSTANTQSPGVG